MTTINEGRAVEATRDSYGIAPEGYRLPGATRLGAVRLQVASLERSVEFYRTVLGLRAIEQRAGYAAMAADDGTILVELVERAGARPAGRRARLGLFHFAILLPDRASLGRFALHASELGVRLGAGDHLVSEALYLSDPDGLGIEVYADRPRDAWRRVGRELEMTTDPLDMRSLAEAAGGERWSGMPAGTVMGHVHLHVGDLERGAAFYADAVGFDRTVWSYPGALFLAAGGYHHHLGTNVWAGPAAGPATADDAQLLEWRIVVPGVADVEAAAASIGSRGHAVERDGADIVARDPWGTAVRITANGR